MTKFIFSLGLIIVGLASGYGMQRLVARNVIRLPLETLRKRVQRLVVLVFNPITSLGAVWSVELHDAALLWFPLLEVASVLLGAFTAILLCRALRLTPKQTGSLLICSALSNVGSIGGVVCYLLMGEAGFAFVMIYGLLYPLSYTLALGIAKTYSSSGNMPAFSRTALKSLLTDPLILMTSLSILAGGALNLAGVPRPAGYAAINAVLIPGSTFLLLMSIGFALRFSRLHTYFRECLLVAGIKFAVNPLCLTLLAVVFGYGSLYQGLPLKVILLLAAMPVAFNALVVSSLYDFDLDLSNACFLFTTLALLAVLPVVYVIMTFI